MWYAVNIQKSYIEFATLKTDRSSRKNFVNEKNILSNEN